MLAPAWAGFVTRARTDGGFGVIELLVVLALLTLVLGALMGPMISTMRGQARDANYASAQQDARTGLDSMVSQIRQASAILSTTSNSVEFNVTLAGTAQHVLYECDVPQPGTSYRECVRLQAAAGVSLPALATGAVKIRNLTNGTGPDPVFSFGPDPVAPYYMTATIKVPSSGGTASSLQHPIVFTDGVLMRNLNVGN
jgi:Tfp pilus assembly protein PilW